MTSEAATTPVTDDVVVRLEELAEHCPSRALFVHTGGPEDVVVTCADLWSEVTRVAAWLRSECTAGSRVVLQLPRRTDFVVAVLACFRAGRVAVPVSPPPRGARRFEAHRRNLGAIIEDADAELVVTSSELPAEATGVRSERPLAARFVGLGRSDGASVAGDDSGDADRVAYLQYTSGSTGSPKGVRISRSNLADNLRCIEQQLKLDETTIGVTWLPLHHDMGLVGGVLSPIFTGFTSVLMPPDSFLRSPLSWLHTLDRFGATYTGGSVFGYRLCVERARRSPGSVDGLDLSRLRVAAIGAEPIPPTVLDDFVSTFGPSGFRRRAFFPCYGLAESTLFVSGAEVDGEPIVGSFDADRLRAGEAVAPEPGRPTLPLTSCGQAIPGMRIDVVDDGGQRLPERRVGELTISGPSVAAGYWARPDRDGPLGTGDLGFVDAGQVYVVGRCKDVIIVRGRNFTAEDVERSVEGAHPALRPGASAAFPIDVDGEEGLGIVLGITGRAANGADIVDAVREAVAADHGIAPAHVAIVPRHALPRTTSGKIQRYACRELIGATFDDGGDG